MSLSQKLASGSGLSADKLFRAAMTVGLIAAAALGAFALITKNRYAGR